MKWTWLADVLRAAGVNVVEEAGWKTRGKELPHDPIGVICHHTAGGHSIAGTLGVVTNGRPDVSGPLCNIMLDEQGTAHLVAAGRANHAGVTRVTLDGQTITDGGSNFVGIEAMNLGDGKDPWEPAQMDAYAKICAAIQLHTGKPATNVLGHKESAWPRGRKIDPTFDMNAFRARVAQIMEGEEKPPVPVPHAPAETAMLKMGDQGPPVLDMQQRLKKLGYAVPLTGVFSWMTRTALKDFQFDHGLAADAVVGPQTWAAFAKEDK